MSKDNQQITSVLSNFLTPTDNFKIEDMKRLIVTVFIIISQLTTGFAQTDEEKKQYQKDSESEVNLLTAPVSPASSLLGFATTDVEKPTEISEFMVSLQTATNSLTKLPASYAIDLAPFLLFGAAGDVTVDVQNSHTIAQTLILSLAVKNTDSTETVLNKESVYGGIGFKFSICRGDFDTKTKESLRKLGALQSVRLQNLKTFSNGLLEKISINKEIMELKEQRKNMLRRNIAQEAPEYKAITDTIEKKILANADFEKIQADLDQNNKEIQTIAADFQLARKGFSWDVAGGISAEFVNKNFEKSRVNNAGMWTTFGYSWEKSGSVLGLVRYLYNPDKVYADDNAVNMIDDIATLDAGLRYVYGQTQSKFNLSLEGIYRSVVSGSTDIGPTWRLLFNADYAIYKNQKLTFSFGRNFDGTVTKDGNLIAALSFVKGFGNKRSVNP